MYRVLLRAICFAASLLSATAILSGSSSAQTAQDRAWCLDSKTTPDQTISGCTALIQSGRFYGAELARIYGFRAWAYKSKNDSKLALADYNEALRLDPKNARLVNLRDAYLHSTRMDELWTGYLKEIQDDRDYANWSGPPLDVQAASQR